MNFQTHSLSKQIFLTLFAEDRLDSRHSISFHFGEQQETARKTLQYSHLLLWVSGDAFHFIETYEVPSHLVGFGSPYWIGGRRGYALIQNDLWQ